MKRSARGGTGAVRIIGGQWRGTKLPVADAAGLRPSSDRVRETLFNWLAHASPLQGARVLDLFAGSGVLGLEALSRGAREAFLVERNPALAEALRASVDRLKASDCAHVLRADALALLQAPIHGRFDIVFVDPPFEAGLWPQVLAALPAWLNDAAWLYLEMPSQLEFEPGGDWQAYRDGRTREVRYALYRRVRLVDGAATLAPDPRKDDAASPP